MDDEEEKNKDNLPFTNLYDYWTCYHDRNKSLFIWHGQKMGLLEQTIRRK